MNLRHLMSPLDFSVEELDKLVAQGVSSLSDYLSAQEQLAAALLDGELYAMLRLQQQLLRKQYISKL